MRPLFDQKRVFLVGGPGGVGKTTLAASLAIKLASEGHRTIVLTVDPARRLAQALGFDTFHSDVQPVPIPGKPDAKLFATMLDTQRYFDRIIDRFATSQEQKAKILGNPMYRIMVDSLGGSHEYAAMERLLEFASDPSYDKVIVDTPPSQNAIDLFQAPQRLADFMDNSVLRWFQGSSSRYLSLFRTGTKIAMKAIHKIFGSDFLDSLGQFLTDIEGMQAGFRSRHLEVIKLLQSEAAAFFLVNFPSEARYLESEGFLATLAERGIPLHGIYLNRVEPAGPSLLPPLPDLSDEARQRADAILAYTASLHRQQQTWIDRFKALGKAHTPVVLLEKRGGALHDVTALASLGEAMVSL